MNDIKKIGKLGEDAAADHLIKNGYKVIGRNVRVGNKEIDIICTDNEYIVFVEVKSKLSDSITYFSRPSAAIRRDKKNNLIIAAERYVRDNRVPFIPRIDVIEVYIDESNVKIEHIRSAVTRNDYSSKKRRY